VKVPLARYQYYRPCIPNSVIKIKTEFLSGRFMLLSYLLYTGKDYLTSSRTILCRNGDDEVA